MNRNSLYSKYLCDTLVNGSYRWLNPYSLENPKTGRLLGIPIAVISGAAICLKPIASSVEHAVRGTFTLIGALFSKKYSFSTAGHSFKCAAIKALISPFIIASTIPYTFLLMTRTVLDAEKASSGKMKNLSSSKRKYDLKSHDYLCNEKRFSKWYLSIADISCDSPIQGRITGITLAVITGVACCLAPLAACVEHTVRGTFTFISALFNKEYSFSDAVYSAESAVSALLSVPFALGYAFYVTTLSIGGILWDPEKMALYEHFRQENLAASTRKI